MDKGFDEIKKERGITMHIAMDLLYRFGGLTGTEIGEMMGVDYSAMSQGRKRLRETIKRDKCFWKSLKESKQIWQEETFDLDFPTRNLAWGRAAGLISDVILKKLSNIQMIDIHLLTTDGHHIVMSRYTQPEKDVSLLLAQTLAS